MNELEVDLTWTPYAASTFRVEAAFRLGAECGVLFGPSGAGKSTILRLIAGLARPSRGKVRLGSEFLFDSSRAIDRPLRHRQIGLIFQDDLLFPHVSVAGNIAFGLKGWRRPEVSGRVEQVAALCGVAHLLDRRPETLSGGERQRVGLARAMAPRPRLLLCDEPVSALDLPARDVLIERIKNVQQAEGIPLLYVTHSPIEAISLGTRLFRLESGRIIDEGLPLDVLARAGGRALEGVENRFAATVESHPDGAGESVVRLQGGPTLIVPRLERAIGSEIMVHLRADDVLLARGPIEGLSARNVVAGEVVRLVEHGAEAEVVVRTGEVEWIASVVAPAVRALGLCAGAAVHMIVKARSCHVGNLERASSSDKSDGDTLKDEGQQLRKT